MTWTTKTPQERADLRKRRAARRARKERNQSARAEEKTRRTHSTADRADLHYDIARKTIAGTRDSQMQAARYRRLVELLKGFCAELTDGHGR